MRLDTYISVALALCLRLFTYFGKFRILSYFFYTDSRFRLPPLVVETISVMLVVYKAVHHFQLGAPKSWTGSRFMNSIVRYSVFYFVVSVPSSILLLSFMSDIA